MTPIGRRLRTPLVVAALVAILAAAWGVQQITPGDDDWQDPFAVPGTLGEPVEGRRLEVTVSTVRIADRITSSRGWVGETAGLWVIADATVLAQLENGGLGTAELVIDGVRYGASERPGRDSLEDSSLRAGVPMRGALAFEVPETALDGDDIRLEIAASSETRLDSLLVIPLDLDDAERVDELELPDVEEGTT